MRGRDLKARAGARLIGLERMDARMDPARRLFAQLRRAYGPQAWWPAETPFEVIVGALLMPQTSWRNVEAAIANLRAAELLTPERLAAAPLAAVRRHVRIAGLHRAKPRRLQAFARHLVDRWDGDLKAFFGRPTAEVRRALLALPGIGPETADSILLYAGGHPVFVVDAYTVRIGARVGLFESTDYEAVQAYFDARVPRTAAERKEDHALLVEHAKAVCRVIPRCASCPIRPGCAFGRQRS